MNIDNFTIGQLKQIAAHPAKLLEGVEMPEPSMFITPDGSGFRLRLTKPVTDVALGWDSLFTIDQLQSYAAAAALNARVKALEEAKQEAVKRHNAGEVGGVLISAAIEQLKGKV